MIFIIWLVLSIIIATNKERSFVGFFFLSIFLSPLVGILAALIAAPDEKKVIERDISSGQKRKCPYCKELIQPDAILCRYCKKEVSIKKLTLEEWSAIKSKLADTNLKESINELNEIYKKHFGKDYEKIPLETNMDIVETIVKRIEQSFNSDTK